MVETRLASCVLVKQSPNFIDQLAAYGSDSPPNRRPICSEVRAPFYKTTMIMTSWKLSHDKIDVGTIPEELLTLIKDVEADKPLTEILSTLPLVSSQVALVNFAAAPSLSTNCHELSSSLAGLTLQPTKDLLKEDFEARRDLLHHLRAYLGTHTACTLFFFFAGGYAHHPNWS